MKGTVLPLNSLDFPTNLLYLFWCPIGLYKTLEMSVSKKFTDMNEEFFAEVLEKSHYLKVSYKSFMSFPSCLSACICMQTVTYWDFHWSGVTAHGCICAAVSLQNSHINLLKLASILMLWRGIFCWHQGGLQNHPFQIICTARICSELSNTYKFQIQLCHKLV